MIPEWMRAEGMAGRSVNDGDRPADSPEDDEQRSSRDGIIGQVATGRQTFAGDGTLVSAAGDRDAGDRLATAINYPQQSRPGDPAESRRAINLKNMRQSARNWHLVGKRGGHALQSTLCHSEKPAVIQFREKPDSDDETSSAISDGRGASRDSAGITAEHDAELIRAPLIDYPNQSRESSSINQPSAKPTGSDRNEVGALSAETLVNRANKRTSDRSENEEASRAGHASDIDDRSKTIVETHLDVRNISPLDNRSASTADYLVESNNFDAANESANSLSGPTVDTFPGDSAVSIEGRVDENSDLGTSSERATDPTDIPDGTRAAAAACDSLYRGSDDDDIRTVRAKKLGKAEGSFARVNDASAIPPVNDSDIDGVDSEAPFMGFEGSQKFPVKVNQKTSTAAAQVEKFDRRHFGPHKEDAPEETSTWWYSSTVAPDLPKSLGRDVLHRHRKTGAAASGDDVTDEDNSAESSGDGKRNDTLEEQLSSWLPGASSGRRAVKSGENLVATTDYTTDGAGYLESATRDGNDSSVGRMDIGVTVSSAKSIEKINITILGLFEMTHGAVPRPEGSSELQAAKLAVDRVNELDVSKYFRLLLIYNDTKVSTGGERFATG